MIHAVVYTGGVEYGTGRPMEIGRVEKGGLVTLASRYLDDDVTGWFVTWVGGRRCSDTKRPSVAHSLALANAPRTDLRSLDV